LNSINNYLENRSDWQSLLSGILLVALVGGFDYLTGYEISFSIFYLVPVSLVAWYCRKYIVAVICVLSAITWFIVDYNSGHIYSNVLILYWNALVRLGFFAIMAYLLIMLKTRLKYEEQQARSDGLTGIMNARTFTSVFATFFDLAKRHGQPICLAYIDLDNFKSVNDTYGHSEGDRVLIKLAELFNTKIRSTDFVARLGGDEFAILLPQTDYSGAMSAIGSVHQSALQLIHKNRWPISLSIGIAVFKKPRLKADEAIRYADSLMYQVKKKGKNNIMARVYRENEE
jgi:diguanylate cyclase (GGDEF)-like protein